MAKGNSTFNISLKLLDQNFRKGLSNIQKQIRGLGNFVKGAFALGSITAFGKQMIQVATDFEDAMARVRAVSNASASDLQMMTDEARKLGSTTRYTATEAAGALENLTRNGMSASQATQALSGTLQFAQANAIGLAESADIVSNTLNMFGMSAKETARVSDVLSSVASTTATNVSEIYAALVNVAPASTALGISLEETAAAVGALAQRGVKAEQAGTALRTALTKMIDPKIVAKMKEMGVAVDEQVVKEEGLIGVLKRFKEANLETADLVTIFSQRGAIGVRQLIDAYDDLELELEITRNAAGTTMRMFEQGVGTTRAAIDTLKSAYEGFLISLGTKSNSVFVGILNTLTSLIKNFNTVSGTLLNLASVVVPLFTKKAVTMFTAFSAGAKKAAADAVTLKMAMGDWITLIATGVTWLGTYLYTLGNVTREAKELDKQLDNTAHQTEILRNKTTDLLNTLGPDTDTRTLAGVVQKLTEMYPDFKKQISDAAIEAGKTGEWEKLRKVMDDIIGLQEKALRNAKLVEAMNKYTELIATKMEKAAANGGSAAGMLKNELEAAYKSFQGGANKEEMHSVWKNIAQIIYQSQTTHEAVEEIMNQIFAPIGHSGEFLSKKIERFVSEWFNTEYVSKAASYFVENAKNQAALDKAEEERKKAEEAAAEQTKKAQEAAAKAEEERKKKADKAKSAAEKIEDVEKTLQKELQNVQDDFEQGINGIKTFGDYANKVYQLWEKAYLDLRSLTGETGTDNKYYGGMLESRQKANGLDIPRPSADFQKVLKDANQVKNTGKPKGPQGLKTDTYPAVEPSKWLDYVTYTDDAIAATSMFTSSLQSLQSAFDTLADDDASWIDRLAAASRVLETIEGTIMGVTKLINLMGDAEVLAAKKEEIASALGLKAKKKDVVANTAKAATGAAASQASIPYVGPILAIAAVATILAALAAATPKFANGGIVQGNSKYGDRLLARVNAGEAILNQRQQKRLLDIADGKGGNGAQQVQFFISGKDLVGVIRNNNSATSRIAGAKGM